MISAMPETHRPFSLMLLVVSAVWFVLASGFVPIRTDSAVRQSARCGQYGGYYSVHSVSASPLVSNDGSFCPKRPRVFTFAPSRLALVVLQRQRRFSSTYIPVMSVFPS